MAQLGVPVKLLHEAEGHIVTCETVTGVVYRGKLLEAEDNMNCQIIGVTCTARDGRVTKLEQVFIRGSQIRFLILPDMLKNAPMFKRMQIKGLFLDFILAYHLLSLVAMILSQRICYFTRDFT